MPTLILSQRYTPDSEALWRAALHRGWDVERIRGYACDPALAAGRPVLYGETLFADAVVDALDLALLQPTEDWLPSLPAAYRRRDVRLATLEEACRLDAPAFVKAPDEKWWPARVYAPGALASATPGMDPHVPALIATPVVFEVEYRLFVLERRIIALSPYIRGGEIAGSGEEWQDAPGEVDEATAFARGMLDDPAVALPAAVVVDAGRIAERGWAVVEANAAWASGLCGCDPRAVLDVLERASVARGAVTGEDRRWVRDVTARGE